MFDPCKCLTLGKCVIRVAYFVEHYSAAYAKRFAFAKKCKIMPSEIFTVDLIYADMRHPGKEK